MTCCLNKNINSRSKNWVSLIKSVEIRQKRAVRPYYANLYAYAANNPVRYIDPDGRDVILLNRSWGANLFGGLNGYHKSAASKKPIKKVDYDTIHKGIQGTGNIIV